MVLRALVWSGDKERQGNSFRFFPICVGLVVVFFCCFLDSTTKSRKRSLLSGDIGNS